MFSILCYRNIVTKIFKDSLCHTLIDDIIFDSIIHDPPKFSLAGELYGFEFYSQLFRILKSGGRIFHYVGDPYSKGRGRLFLEGIEKRMKKAGFMVKPVPEDLGIIAWKN